ncbi:hypothetical protein ACH3XW_49735 [Acanthocheilonema viteae]
MEVCYDSSPGISDEMEANSKTKQMSAINVGQEFENSDDETATISAFASSSVETVVEACSYRNHRKQLEEQKQKKDALTENIEKTK